MDRLLGYDAVGLGELVRGRQISSIELLESTVERIERLDPRLNAVIERLYDGARQAAVRWDAAAGTTRAIFCGVPFLLKDLIAECEGTPFSEGSRAVKGYRSRLDSELVRRQKASGLIIVGKTNTPEFGALPTTEPALYGATVNPWNPLLTPGGSSGGSAAAVAAGIVPMAHANDGGGSIRVPASCCGVFGLKPTRGRNPLGPLFGDLAGGIIQEHAVTRTVRDSAALLDATAGSDASDPYVAPPAGPFFDEVGRPPGRLRIGMLDGLPEGWADGVDLHPDCIDAVQDAGRLCSSLGHVVEEIAPAPLGNAAIARAFGTVFSCFIGYAVAYWERELGKKIVESDLEPITWSRYQAALRRTPAEYLVAIEQIQRFARQIARWRRDRGYDLLLTPTMAVPPMRLGQFRWTPEEPTRWIQPTLAALGFTRIQNMTGQPAMSVPLYWNRAGVPIGVQFAGRLGDEATLFRLAAQLEEVRPWAHRWPAIHCGA
jgi:amidase